MRADDLANGPDGRSRSDAGRAAAAVGPLRRWSDRAPSPTAGRRDRPSVRAYGVQGRRRPLGARASARRSRMSAATLNACTERDGPLHGAHHGRASAARGRTHRRPGSHPHFTPAELEREKEVVLQELGESRDTPGDLIFDHLWSAAFGDQPIGRSILGNEDSVQAVTARRSPGWRSEQYRAVAADPGRGRQGRP